ncbi:hypothetical protein Skr01_50510 [Sphaerisporangium krabiense]|uniref:Ca-activated chloride channel family protein n=1 Tax=Sphaerisporangium krabiense TaxID=763782 RepID=A0A7W8Z9X6_9ACTN|nr:von Willebrand factor type A domain-containing protein [Sphaerisporangium krabiense]MBB5630020.1 Ca-activated chloride channel family protein [Sphaerisporangium krabiense]GII64966.1 hypothetical protein Skr01_50510 [Sphaerisporangium krabiense]
MKTRYLTGAVVALTFFLSACAAGEPVSTQSDGGAHAPAPTAPVPPEERRPSSSSSPAERSPAELSTFALDVDTASYGYAKTALKDGRLPAPGQVRPEEFVNAFRQGYAEPPGDGFSVQVDGARRDGGALLRVGLQTRTTDTAARRPANLTFVVDVSGSMGDPGRLDLVRESLHTLVDQLGPGDAVAIVSFSDQARLRLPMTGADRREDLHAAIDTLAVEGSTNLEAGLVTGYQEASRAFRPVATNRVVVLSDGLANTGDTTWQGILKRVEEHAARGVTLLCVGVGRDYGDALMERLADNGDGAAIYVSSREDARQVFVERLPAALDLRARDAKAQVAFNPATVESYRLVGYENRALAQEDFRDDTKDGGEVGPGHAVTALYEVRLKPGASGQLAVATVRWLDPDSRAPGEASRALEVAGLSGSLWEGAPTALQVDAVVAGFAQRLRGAGDGLLTENLGDLSDQATRLAALTQDPMVAELAELIRTAASLR